MFFLKTHAEKIKIKNEDSNEVYAPVNGKVVLLEDVEDVVFPPGHVVGITTAEGANIILHVGIDTVELKGKGFDVKVKQGDKVEAGQLLMKVDLPFVKKYHPATIMVILEKTDEFKSKCVGSKQIRVGERLLTLERIT